MFHEGKVANQAAAAARLGLQGVWGEFKDSPKVVHLMLYPMLLVYAVRLSMIVAAR